MFREHTKTVTIGNKKIGGGNPVLIQSMTNTHTEDVEATVRQILELEAAGCEIIRCTVPTIEAAKIILKTLGLRKGGIEVVSCPTCGRTRIDLIGLAKQVEEMVSSYDYDLKLAVMGCVVNGPGEAKEADLGIAGGDGCGVLIKHGEVVCKVPEDELLSTLKYELDHWGGTGV